MHMWKVRTLEDRDLDIKLAHLWDKKVYLGHRTGAHVGAVDTLATELYYGSSLLCS